MTEMVGDLGENVLRDLILYMEVNWKFSNKTRRYIFEFCSKNNYLKRFLCCSILKQSNNSQQMGIIKILCWPKCNDPPAESDYFSSTCIG